MTEPLDLAPIEARDATFDDYLSISDRRALLAEVHRLNEQVLALSARWSAAGVQVHDVDALLAEVKRLRAQLARRAGTRDQLPPGVVACARCGDPTISQLPWPPQTAANAEMEVCTRCYDAIDVELTQPEETP